MDVYVFISAAVFTLLLIIIFKLLYWAIKYRNIEYHELSER
jgi:hypothetical protein